MDEYHVPKEQVTARVSLVGCGPRRTVQLYLSADAERHAGMERPSDLLNGAADFIPVCDPEDGFLLVQRDSIVVLSVDREVEPGLESEEEGSELVTREDVEVALEGDIRLSGTVSFVMPKGQRRLQDFLKAADHFFVIHEGDTAQLVNRRRLLWISPTT